MTESALAVGDAAPDFTLPTDAGEPWSLAAQRGRTLLLVFHRHLQ